MAAAAEELPGALAIDGDRDRHALTVLEVLIGQQEGGLSRTAPAAAGIVGLRHPWIGDGGDPDGPRLVQRGPPFAGRPVMRFEIARRLYRTSGVDIDGDLAAQIDAF